MSNITNKSNTLPSSWLIFQEVFKSFDSDPKRKRE